MFDGIKKSYNSKVGEIVKAEAMENIDDCIMLVNFIMPELRTVLGRQRRDYGLSEDVERFCTLVEVEALNQKMQKLQEKFEKTDRKD